MSTDFVALRSVRVTWRRMAVLPGFSTARRHQAWLSCTSVCTAAGPR